MKYTPKQIEHQIELLEIKLYKEGLTIEEVKEYDRLKKILEKKNELET